MFSLFVFHGLGQFGDLELESFYLAFDIVSVNHLPGESF
jgi:hypothetical protein